MAELQPPETAPINGNGLLSSVAAAIVSGGGLLPASTTAAAMTSSETVGSKRQRRPSVRLGDLGGDQAYDSLPRRSAAAAAAGKPWKSLHHSHSHLNQSLSAAKSSSKIRPLVNFSESDEREGGSLEATAIGSWKQLKEASSSKKRAFPAAKRVRSNWRLDEDDGDDAIVGDDGVVGGGENSDSPVNSIDERDNLYNNNNNTIRARSVRGARVSVDRHNNHDGMELLSGPSEEWNDVGGGGGGGGIGEDGVRVWLNGMGLGRYAPVFEIHEVDDEVLPMLTLEDLKDMGINAVGSRRKMFCAIQKLGKGFS